MKEILQYLKDIRRVNLYTALFVKELKEKKIEALEDQLYDIDTNVTALGDAMSRNAFNTDGYWQDQEIKVSFLYLQDLIFEFPDENPAVLAKQSLDKARQVVAALKSEFV